MFFQNFIQIVNKFLLCQKKKVNKFLLKHSKWEIQTSSEKHVLGGRYKQICVKSFGNNICFFFNFIISLKFVVWLIKW
jgi:hypothetical protein